MDLSPLKSSRTLSNHKHLAASSRTSNTRRRECPATLEDPSNPGDDVLQTASKSFDLQSRSRIVVTREEPSCQVSLTAGDFTPGPSDAPCLAETSTAQDEPPLRDPTASTETIKSPWYSSSTSKPVQNSQEPTLLSPEMTVSPQNPPPSPYGRCVQFSSLRAIVKLGFQRVGLPFFGPLSYFNRCDPIQFLQKPRSVTKTSLSISSQSLCRLLEFIDRRHQSNHNSPLLLLLYKNLMRNLPLVSPRAVYLDPKSLKKNRIVVLMLRLFWGYKEDCENQKRNLEPLLYASNRIPYDYKTIVPRTLADELLCLALLVPARTSASELSTTSLSHSTVTITSSNASFVDEPSANLVITYANLLLSICLQALKEPLSNSLIYSLMALEDVLLCFILILESLVSLLLKLVLI